MEECITKNKTVPAENRRPSSSPLTLYPPASILSLSTSLFVYRTCTLKLIVIFRSVGPFFFSLAFQQLSSVRLALLS